MAVLFAADDGQEPGPLPDRHPPRTLISPHGTHGSKIAGDPLQVRTEHAPSPNFRSNDSAPSADAHLRPHTRPTANSSLGGAETW